MFTIFSVYLKIGFDFYFYPPGKPLYNSIVWLDNRASELVSKILKEKSATDIAAVKAKTGLTISSYFSALKIRWLLENVPEVRAAAKEHRLAFGTVDSWLCYRLTGGARHITDVTNASRTLLMDLETLRWDPFLCEFFGIPMSILPAIEPCAAAHGIIAQVGVDWGWVEIAASFVYQLLHFQNRTKFLLLPLFP